MEFKGLTSASHMSLQEAGYGSEEGQLGSEISGAVSGVTTPGASRLQASQLTQRSTTMQRLHCHSQRATLCFVVPKKVAVEWRLVADYRGLNAQMQHDSYTLSLIEDMLQKQFWWRMFTVIDLKHGYHQMPSAEESCTCTAMSTPFRPLQWKVMPMGVTNGNATFQRMPENLLELVRDCLDPFVKDVIIASGDPSMSYDELLGAHERDVTRVPDLLLRHKLTGSSEKAIIAVSKVVSAGHVVGNGQRKPIPGKVASIGH